MQLRDFPLNFPFPVLCLSLSTAQGDMVRLIKRMRDRAKKEERTTDSEWEAGGGVSRRRNQTDRYSPTVEPTQKRGGRGRGGAHCGRGGGGFNRSNNGRTAKTDPANKFHLPYVDPGNLKKHTLFLICSLVCVKKYVIT
jgi:hypothetical protein